MQIFNCRNSKNHVPEFEGEQFSATAGLIAQPTASIKNLKQL